MTLRQNLFDMTECGIVLLIVLSMIFGIPILVHHGNIKEAFQPDPKPSVKLDEVQFNTLITTLRGETND